MSERERVERSSHDRYCLADIQCEDPSTSLRSNAISGVLLLKVLRAMARGVGEMRVVTRPLIESIRAIVWS